MFNVKHKKKKLHPKEKIRSFHNVSAKKLMCHITLSNVLLVLSETHALYPNKQHKNIFIVTTCVPRHPVYA